MKVQLTPDDVCVTIIPRFNLRDKRGVSFNGTAIHYIVLRGDCDVPEYYLTHENYVIHDNIANRNQQKFAFIRRQNTI